MKWECKCRTKKSFIYYWKIKECLSGEHANQKLVCQHRASWDVRTTLNSAAVSLRQVTAQDWWVLSSLVGFVHQVNSMVPLTEEKLLSDVEMTADFAAGAMLPAGLMLFNYEIKAGSLLTSQARSPVTHDLILLCPVIQHHWGCHGIS